MYVLLKEGLAVYKYHCTALTIDALENVYTVRSCTVLWKMDMRKIHNKTDFEEVNLSEQINI